MRDKSAARRLDEQDDGSSGTVEPMELLAPGSDMLDRQRLDALTHARLWKNPCGFAARFNFLARRYNVPLYGWVQEHYGLSRVEFIVIYNLAVAGTFTASEIAASTAFPKNTLSRAVNRLAKLGLITRKADGTDRRAQNLALTEKGQAIYDEALPRFAGLEQEMLAPLNLVEREMLSMLLAKVVTAMFNDQPVPDFPDEP